MISQATCCRGAPQPLQAACLQSCIPSVCALRVVPLFLSGHPIQGAERAVVEHVALLMGRQTLQSRADLAMRFGFAKRLRFPIISARARTDSNEIS